MPIARFLPVFVSVFVSAGLWILGIMLMPPGGRGYAVLVCSEAVPDRELRECLENQGFVGLVSESGQWVLLDSFGSIERIPLDEYDSRVLPFDPRNDGYAQKLRALFVQDGRRFIYIPVSSRAALAIMEKRLAVTLGDIAYSFEYANKNRALPTVFFIVLFFIAAGAFWAIRPLRLLLQPYAAGLIPCLPILAPLALGGAAGLALGGLLAGFAVLLASFSESFFLTHRQKLPRVLRRLLPFALMACYGTIVIVSGLSLVFTLLALAGVCGMVIFSLRSPSRVMVLGEVLFKRRNFEHRRFSPVPILRRHGGAFAFIWAMLPFAAAALIPVFAGAVADLRSRPPSIPAASTALPSAAVTEADYHRHYLFQSTFSQRALYAPDLPGGMSVYELAPDGLLNLSFQEEERSMAGIPPFPLGDLLRYLETIRANNRQRSGILSSHQIE